MFEPEYYPPNCSCYREYCENDCPVYGQGNNIQEYHDCFTGEFCYTYKPGDCNCYL